MISIITYLILIIMLISLFFLGIVIFAFTFSNDYSTTEEILIFSMLSTFIIQILGAALLCIIH